MERITAAVPQRPTGARVLIVFDELFVRTIIRLALRREGYRVHEAITPTEASRLWYQHAGEIDVAIVDEDAGGEASRDFVARLRRTDPKVRVLFAAREPAGEALRGNPPVLLPKPFDLGQLLGALSQLNSTAGRS